MSRRTEDRRGPEKRAPKRTSTRAPKNRRNEPAQRRAEPGTLAERPLREDLVTQACLEAYASVRRDGRLADRALDFTLRHKRHLYSNERRAVAERIYALLRRQLTVDFLLGKLRPGFSALGASEQDLLRLATSRLLAGERPNAVIKSCGLSPADAALLPTLPEALRTGALDRLPAAEAFSIRASLPKFLAERLRKELGDEADAAAEAMNERAPLCIRANPHKTTREALAARLAEEGVEAKPTPLSPFGLTLHTRINAFSLASFKDGLFEVQDEGSQLLGMLVDAPPTKVVDACAGAGGKTLQLSAQMKNRGELFALDIDERRLDELKKRARRAGAHNVRTRLIPADEAGALEALADLVGKADRVFVDAPCSGTGTFRRKPDARYRLSPESLAEHAERQKALLERFSRLLKPNGRLVYGTCSLLREENEAVVEDFLARHPDFEVLSAEAWLGTALGEGGATRVTRGGCLRLYPHRHDTDGFFGAVLARKKPTA